MVSGEEETAAAAAVLVEAAAVLVEAVAVLVVAVAGSVTKDLLPKLLVCVSVL